MTITEPDQVWCSDITHIRLAHGFVYLTVVMDWASRYVLSVTMDDDFCVNALKSALRRHKTPEIFNTDQGAQDQSLVGKTPAEIYWGREVAKKVA